MRMDGSFLLPKYGMIYFADVEKYIPFP